MNTYSKDSRPIQARSVAEQVAQKKGGMSQGDFMDNRPESTLQRQLGSSINAASAGVAQLERSKNPNRQDTDAYKSVNYLNAKLEEGDRLPVPEDTDLTEHHIVPHALLVAAKKKAKGSIENAVMPNWAEVSLRQMCNLKFGWKADWVLKYNKANPDAKMSLDDLAKDKWEVLRDFLLDKGDDEERSLAGRMKYAQGLFKDGDPDSDWASAFYEWMPGNIVLGPTERKHDQHDGMALDKEMVYLLNQLGQMGHAMACLELDAVCRELIVAKKPAELRERFEKAVLAVSRYGYTHFMLHQQFWQVSGKGDSELKASVKGYEGN